MLKRRTVVWLVVLTAAFAFRLFFGLSSEFFSQDETQIYLLGLRYYATGAWPYFGADVVWTNSEIPGALQALLVGVPFRIAAVPEAPFVLLNLLSTSTLAALAWYISKRLPSLPRWLTWGWLLTIPWTLQFSTHINNVSYVLPAAIVFFIGFFEATPAFAIGALAPPIACFMMGFAISWVTQIHMSWPLLVPYAFVAWISGKRDGGRALAGNALALAAGALVPALVLAPTLLRYGTRSTFNTLRFHAVSPSVALTTLARLFSFASLEIFRFIGLDNAKRFAFFERHIWLVPLAAIVWIVGVVQPLWMALEWFRRRSPYPEWTALKWLVAITVLLVYAGDWFTIPRATEAHAFYLLAPLAFVFAAYCWTFIDSPAWRRRAAVLLAINIVFEAGLAWAQLPERSLYQHRNVVATALRSKEPEMFAHRRPSAVDPGPVALNDPSRPYDAGRDLEVHLEPGQPTYSSSARGAARWRLSIRNTDPRVAFRNLCAETTYRFKSGAIAIRHSRVNDVIEPGETRSAQFDDNAVRGDMTDATLAIIFAEALLPIGPSSSSSIASLPAPSLERFVGRDVTGTPGTASNRNSNVDVCDPDAGRLQ